MTHSSRLTALAAALALACLQAACSGDPQAADATPDPCSNEPTAETYTANMLKNGTEGAYKFMLLSSTPGPPAKGDNTWSLQLTDMNDAPIDGATLDVTPFMPEHGHGPGVPDVVTPGGAPGEYTATPVNLWMPGLWEITLDATAAGTSDTVVFRFCIEG